MDPAFRKAGTVRWRAAGLRPPIARHRLAGPLEEEEDRTRTWRAVVAREDGVSARARRWRDDSFRWNGYPISAGQWPNLAVTESRSGGDKLVRVGDRQRAFLASADQRHSLAVRQRKGPPRMRGRQILWSCGPHHHPFGER